jgi:hypothetical protein
VTPPIRFLFDECISRPVVEQQIAPSLELYGADATVTHFLAKYSSGAKDQDWILSLAKEGGWVIVTMDRGRHSRRSESLPLICRHFRVTHVMLSAGLEKRSMFYRATAIEACWQELIAAASCPPGTGFVLSMRTVKDGVSFRVKQETNLTAAGASIVQKSLPGL